MSALHVGPSVVGRPIGKSVTSLRGTSRLPTAVPDILGAADTLVVISFDSLRRIETRVSRLIATREWHSVPKQPADG